VPGASWSSLALLVSFIIVAPILIDMVTDRLQKDDSSSDEEE
jgi:hypothetical protein